VSPLRRQVAAGLALGLVLALGVARAQEAKLSVEAFRAKVQAAMANVKTTRGKFRQTKRLALFDDKLESSGSFAIQRPDRLRWEIERPFRSILVIAGDKGARWNETRREVERFSLAEKPGIDAAVKQLFSWYSGGFDAGGDQFTVTVESERTVALVPKNEKVREVVKKFSIRLAPDFATIEAIALDESEGDRTEIEFSETEVNKNLDPKTFEIEK
jgi:outer membrane lipoprotein-sorting protein